MNKEKMQHHISHLEEKFNELKRQVDTMERTGIYEDKEMNLLKKEKLHLKDEIERLKSSIQKP